MCVTEAQVNHNERDCEYRFPCRTAGTRLSCIITITSNFACILVSRSEPSHTGMGPSKNTAIPRASDVCMSRLLKLNHDVSPSFEFAA
jgi:hypothetical protein